ncbi:MAG: ACP S-malonyltransferase [Sphaerochaetaceae bacterium]
MDSLIALYPGQGSQKPKMALDLFAASKQVKALFALASEVGGLDMYQLLNEGSESELKQTKATQLAVTLASRSAYLRLTELGFSFIAHSGFSLGELASYAGGGILDDQALFTLVTKRATLMEKEAKKIEETQGKLGMAAIIGLDYATVEQVLREEDISGIFASNDNSAKQVVISGLQESIAKSKEILQAKGARRIIPLRVSGPFHTPLMEGTTTAFSAFIQDIPFHDPHSLVISSVDGKLIRNVTEAKEQLTKQLAKPVRWTKVMERLSAIAQEQEVQIAEVGFGSVLSGLWKNNNMESLCRNLGEEDEIQAYKKEITV